MISRRIFRRLDVFSPRLMMFSSSSATEGSNGFMDLYSKSTEEFRLGNLDLATEFSRKALAEADETKSVNWRDIAAVQLNLAHMLKLNSQFVDARVFAEKALAGLDARFSSNKLEVCHTLDVLAELCCELGDYPTASEHVIRAIEVKSRIGGTAGASLAKSYNIRGAIMLNEGQLAQARSDFIRALAINVRHHGRDRPLPLSTGITLSNIGGVLRKEGNRVSETVALYREVVESFEGSLSNAESSWMVGSALADLAESLVELGTEPAITEAKDLLTRALHIFLSTRGIGHPSTERAANLLKECGTRPVSDATTEIDLNFVDTLLNECEKVVPRNEGRVSGDVIFLDRRGHIGHGHPHTPLF